MITETKELTEQRVREIVREEIAKAQTDVSVMGQKIVDQIRLRTGERI
jgi:hypothetical protein